MKIADHVSGSDKLEEHANYRNDVKTVEAAADNFNACEEGEIASLLIFSGSHNSVEKNLKSMC